MTTYFVLFLLAFLAAFVGTPLWRALAVRWGLLDSAIPCPPHIRRPVPRLGGVAIYLAVVASLGALLIPSNLITAEFRAQLSFVWTLLAPATLILLVGVADDIWGLRAWPKLSVQVAAALWLYFQGVRISHISLPWGTQWELGWMSLGMTLLWIVGLTNAFNLIDGLDGLAAGTGFLAATAIAATAMMTNNRMVVVISVAVAGALLGFLRHNFTPASIFLGDSGSLFVGFMLSAAAVIWHQKTTTAIAVVVPLLAFTLPIADTTLAVLRRSLRGQPIFLSDREHIHHRLLASGWTPREALLLLYVASGAAAFGCVLILEGQVLVTAAILVAFLVVFVLLGYWMAYPEFMELVERLPKTFSRRDPTIGEPVAQPEAGFGRGLLNPVKPAWEAVPQASQEVKDASSD